MEVDGIGDLEDLGGERRVGEDHAEEVARGAGGILRDGHGLQGDGGERREVLKIFQKRQRR